MRKLKSKTRDSVHCIFRYIDPKSVAKTLVTQQAVSLFPLDQSSIESSNRPRKAFLASISPSSETFPSQFTPLCSHLPTTSQGPIPILSLSLSVSLSQILCFLLLSSYPLIFFPLSVLPSIPFLHWNPFLRKRNLHQWFSSGSVTT